MLLSCFTRKFFTIFFSTNSKAIKNYVVKCCDNFKKNSDPSLKSYLHLDATCKFFSVFKSIYKTVAVAEWIRHWLWNPAVRVQIPVREKSFLQRKLGKSEQDL